MNQFLILFSLLAAAAPRAHAAPAETTEPSPPATWTIHAALDTAIGYSPDVREAQGKVDEAQANKMASYSLLFPNITGSILGSARKDSIADPSVLFGGTEYNLYNFQLTGTQTLFNWGTFSGLGYANKDLQLRKMDLQVAQRDLALKVIETFYQVLLNQNRLDTQLNQEKVLHELDKLTMDRYRVGRSQKLETLQVKAQLAAIKPAVSKAEVEYQVSAFQLANLMGLRDEKALRVSGHLRPLEFDTIQRFLKDRPVQRIEIDRAHLAVEQLSDKASADLGNTHYPKLSLFGTWGRTTNVKSDLLDGDFTVWNYGIRLDIPLFSGLSSLASRRAYAAQGAQLEAQETRTRDTLALQQVQAARQIESSRTQLEAAAASLDVAVESQKLARHDYRLGNANYLQLSQSETDAVNAQFTYEQAQYDYLDNVAKLFVASGWSLLELVDLLEQGGKAVPLSPRH